MKYFHYIFIALLLLFSFQIEAQEKQKKVAFSGHLQDLNTVWVQNTTAYWSTLGSIYNRLNFKWYPNENFTFSASARNVLTYGQLISQYYPYYTNSLVQDLGYVNLTGKIASDTSYVLYTNIDRANLKFTKGKFEATVGRQRINWGINLVWNPNDIFNTFSYYDFDYVERPGCDAVKLQYYTGILSSVQGAFKIDSDKKITAAGMYRFNRWNYDFQLMAGVMRNDMVVGGGWSGNIKTAGFTGEASYFRNKDHFSDSAGYFVFSLGANYTFKNSLFIHGSVLYNNRGTTGKAGYAGTILDLRDLSPKNLSPARMSLFGELSYPLTPLIKADLAGIFNPYDKSAFVGPNVDFSLTDNIGVLFMAQVFIGDAGTEFGNYGQLYYLRLKWSF